MPPADYTAGLRMNSIYGGLGLGPPDMGEQFHPDMITAILNKIEPAFQRKRDMELNNQKELIRYQNEPRFKAIANQMVKPEHIWEGTMPKQGAGTGNNIVLGNAPMSEYQKAQIDLGKQQLAQKTDASADTIGIRQQNTDIAARRAVLAEKIADGKATDAEKQEYDLAKIGARGDIENKQIERRGEIESGQINLRGKIEDAQIQTRGQQALEQIGANIAGRKEIKAIPSGTPMSPSQIGADQLNKIREIKLARPDLAPHLIEDASGQLSIDPNAPPEIQNEIKNFILTPRKQDIQLPSSKPIARPTDKKNDPAGIR